MMETLVLASYIVAGIFAVLGIVRGGITVAHNGRILNMVADEGKVQRDLVMQKYGRKYSWLELVGLLGLGYLVAAWLT